MMPRSLEVPLPAASRWTLPSITALVDRQVITTVGVRLLIVAGGFVSSVVTARLLSPAGRGEYFLVVTLAQTLAQFGNLGLQSSNTYFVARNRSLAGALLGNSLVASVAAGGVGSLVVILAMKAAGGGSATSAVWFAAILAPATLFYMLGTNLLVGLKRIGTFNMFQLGSNYGVLLCLLGAALFGAGSAGFLGASALGWMVVSVCLLVVIRREAGGQVRVAPDVFSQGFRYALKAYVATLFGFLVVRSNVFLLNALHGSAPVGWYSVASQIADIMAILPQSMALVLFPTLITATEGRFRTTLRNLATVGVLLAVACVMVGWLAGPFIAAVFGPKFNETVPLLRWMLPGVFFLGLTSILSQYLAAAGFPISLAMVWVGGFVMSAGLGWALIPQYSAAGAAVALSITHFGIFLAILGLSLTHAWRHRAADAQAVLVEQGVVS